MHSPIHAHTQPHTHTHTHTHTQLHTETHTRTHTHIYTPLHAETHTRTHTQTHTKWTETWNWKIKAQATLFICWRQKRSHFIFCRSVLLAERFTSTAQNFKLRHNAVLISSSNIDTKFINHPLCSALVKTSVHSFDIAFIHRKAKEHVHVSYNPSNIPLLC